MLPMLIPWFDGYLKYGPHKAPFVTLHQIFVLCVMKFQIVVFLFQKQVTLYFIFKRVSWNLYIWFGHYAHKVANRRLFDHQKHGVMLGCFSVMPGFFFWFFSLFVIFLLLVTFVNYFLLLKVHCLLLFVTFFTACNFHKLLFIAERGQGNCFIIFIHCSGGGGAPWFFF